VDSEKEDTPVFSHTFRQLAFLVVVVVVAVTIGQRSSARDQADDRPGLKATPESLFAKINSVTVLEITTDRPIKQYRLLVNGKPKSERLTYKDASDHLYLAAVPSGKWANIHMKIGHANCLLAQPFNMGADKNIQTTIEYMSPKKKVHIGDWTTIYGVTIRELDKVVRSIEVQISGAQPDAPADADKPRR
jgi:hypothetical protein